MSRKRVMSADEMMDEYVRPYSMTSVYWPGEGFIVWRLGTGGNVELLHIKTFESGKGIGRRLVYAMLERLRSKPPYFSVYGFTRVGNDEARLFYQALGFNLEKLFGPYAEGESILFWGEYKDLLHRMDEWRRQNSTDAVAAGDNAAGS